jgi:PAS domain S-box-containing protein
MTARPADRSVGSFPAGRTNGKSTKKGSNGAALERRRTEAALLESEARMRSLTENAPDFIVEVDRDGKILFLNRANPPARVEDVIGTSAYNWAPPEFHPELRSAFTKAFETGEPQHFETLTVTQGNGKRWLACRVAPVTIGGRANSAVVIARDVTERHQAVEKLKNEQRSLRRLLNLQERDRQLVACEIHDGFVQEVIGAKMLLESVARKPDVEGEELDKIGKLLDKAIVEARRLIGDLRPMSVDERGLVEAIEYLVADEREKTNLDIKFERPAGFDRLPPLVEGTLYRIAQEALANIRRHSRATQASVRLSRAAGKATLEIEDNGVGFDPQQVSDDHFGVHGINERARLFGGIATIESAQGQGTRIRVELPIEDPVRG